MATRYEDMISNWHCDMLSHDEYTAYAPWALEMLLRWAVQDPVSQKEIDRNNAVKKLQGNRNPFIDYPGLEQYIWGKYKDAAFSYDKYVEHPDKSGIDGIQTDDLYNGRVYDIMGREVHESYKGIVIKKGRKQLAN